MYNRKGLAGMRGIIPRGRQSGRQALLEVLRAWSRYLHKGLHPVSLRSQWWGEGLPVRWRDAHYLSVWEWRLTRMHTHTRTHTHSHEETVNACHGNCGFQQSMVAYIIAMMWRFRGKSEDRTGGVKIVVCRWKSWAEERQYSSLLRVFSPPASFIFHV